MTLSEGGGGGTCHYYK